MMLEFPDYSLAQKDGSRPTTLAVGSAPGESGVSLLRVRFEGSAHFDGKSQQHVVFFQLSPDMRFECRFAGRALRHMAPPGRLAIAPAGIDVVVDADQCLDAIFVAIDPGRLALAAAEDSALDARIIERMSGYDQALLDLARDLALESAGDYPNGAQFWSEIASGFIDKLIDFHTRPIDSRVRVSLGKDVLARLRDHIMGHLDEPIEVASLASIAGRSPFHFSRVFTRSVGVSPHRYIVYLRLQRAVELVRDGRAGLAQIAACTGFADQSHLSRWVRRVHGVSLTQLAADRKRNSRNLHDQPISPP